MAQKYKKSETVYTLSGKERKYYSSVKGVTIIHLFNNEWRIGRVVRKKGKEAHVVVYSPDEKLYHAYGEEALKFVGGKSGDGINRAEAKIWILINVLDDPDFWSLDMTEQPEVGIPVKVIFENGTIKWLDEFTGDWQAHRLEIPTQYPSKENPAWTAYLFGRVKKDGPEPSQFIWADTIEYKNIVAWKRK